MILQDWMFFLIGVALNVVSIWLSVYLFFRQQREAQNERYRKIEKHLSEISKKVAVIESSMGETQSEILRSHIKTTETVIAHIVGGTYGLTEKRLPIQLPASDDASE